MHHINGVLAFTNKLREIGKPMQELHIINIILSSLPKSYARARSIWTTTPEPDRTVINLTSRLKSEEVIIDTYSKKKTETALFASGNTLERSLNVSAYLTIKIR